MVEGAGFEPAKAEPSDLQSDPFDRSGTPPRIFSKKWCRQRESNSRPTDYKSVALPAELCRRHRLGGANSMGSNSVLQPLKTFFFDFFVRLLIF